MGSENASSFTLVPVHLLWKIPHAPGNVFTQDGLTQQILLRQVHTGFPPLGYAEKTSVNVKIPVT